MSDERKPTGALTWTDWSGKPQSRPLSYALDWRDCPNKAGQAWLIIAANPHLSAPNLRDLLALYEIERPLTWIKRRKWLFQPPKAINAPGVRPNADGLDGPALEIMRTNPKLSARQLSRLLSERGIRRGRDWVLRHRCDADD